MTVVLPEGLEKYLGSGGLKAAWLKTIRERYADVNEWCWQDGVLKDAQTLESVSIEGEAPGWGFVVFLPGDVKYLLAKLDELAASYEELRQRESVTP